MAFNFFELFKYSEAKCAAEMIKLLKKISADIKPIYEPQKNQVKYQNNGKDGFIYLGNIYNHIKSKPKKERYEYLQQFLKSSLDEDKTTYENSADHLVPRLKSKAEIANRSLMSRRLNATPQSYSTYEFTNSYVWELGIDSNAAVKVVTNEILEKLSLSKEEAMAIAKKNLFSISENNSFNELEKGIYLSRYEDDHDAARILMTDGIARLNLKGNPIAFVPASKVLLVCGSEDVDTLNKIHTYIDKLSEDCRPLSRQPLVLVNGVWQDFVPEKTAQFAGVTNQIKIEEFRSYNEQKTQLDEIHDKNNVDVFVSSYKLFEKKESSTLFSTTVWSESVHSWIPKTETISFVAEENGNPSLFGHVNFEDALTNFPDLMRPLGYIPERYEVKDFPNKSQLEKLKIDI